MMMIMSLRLFVDKDIFRGTFGHVFLFIFKISVLFS